MAGRPPEIPYHPMDGMFDFISFPGILNIHRGNIPVLFILFKQRLPVVAESCPRIALRNECHLFHV